MKWSAKDHTKFSDYNVRVWKLDTSTARSGLKKIPVNKICQIYFHARACREVRMYTNGWRFQICISLTEFSSLEVSFKVSQNAV